MVTIFVVPQPLNAPKIIHPINGTVREHVVRLRHRTERRIAINFFLHFRLLDLLPLALVPPVLEPDLDLSGRQLQHLGHLLALGGRQVLLLLEAALQLVDLGLGKEDAGLSLRTLPSRFA